jgi:hypothetical protein
MPTMRELSRWIRNYGQDRRQQARLLPDKFVWHQLWTAMDIIDDVESAMTAYLGNDFPEATGEKYLRIYGVLQGLFIQQDALVDLIKAIHPSKDIRLKDVLSDVREARNASVGHPTQMKRKGVLYAHGIVQNSMRKNGFELLSYPQLDSKVFQHVPVQELIEKQRGEAIRILSEVAEELRAQEEAHRAQFREVKLIDVFNHVSYAFEKIFEEIRVGAAPNLGGWAVGCLRKSLDDFAELLKARGVSVEAYDSIEYLYELIEHPLVQLTKFVTNESSEILSIQSARVFADALRSHFHDLRSLAEEIDREYAAAPEPVVEPEHTHIDIILTSTVIGKQPAP